VAKAKTRKSVEVALLLTQEEAKYLLELTQNYLGYEMGRSEEPLDESICRENIFTALRGALDE